jgi:predicted dehydrogenase
MAGKTRIGFVGVGVMGQCAHLRNYATLDDCEVAAVAELRERTGAEVARRYGVPRVYRSHREMLAAEQLDGIVASQPFATHGALVPELLEAGLPLFIEKPLAGSVDAGERVLQALSASRSWVMVGYNKRSDPATERAVTEIRRLQSSGELGPMRYTRITMPAGDWIAGGMSGLISCGEDARPELRRDPPPEDMSPETFSDYTSFVNYYIHQVNLMRHLLGETYRVTWADPSGVVLGGCSLSGVPCVIEMSPYVTTVDWQESALVCFQRGWVRLDLPAPLAVNRAGSVRIFSDPGDGKLPGTVRPQMPPVSSMRRQAENFLAAVRGERRPPCEAAEALEDLKLAREYFRLLRGT